MLLIAAPVAAARVVEKARRGAPLLTAAERRALTPTSLTAVADAALGLVVTATFNGDVARYLGQNDLKNGLLTLVIEPSSGTQTASVLVAGGGGFSPVLAPELFRRGRQVSVKRTTLDVFSPERLVQTIPGAQVRVVRDGNRVLFFIGQLGLAQPATIELEVFASSPLGSGGGAGGVPASLTPSAFNTLVASRPTAATSAAVTPTQLTVTQLQGLRAQLSDVAAGDLAPQLRRAQQAHARLQAALAQYQLVRKSVRVGRGTLISDIGGNAVAIDHLKAKIAAVSALTTQVGQLIAQTNDPPVAVVQTDPGLSQELTPQPGLVTSLVAPQGVPMIDVDEYVRYQQFEGLGAALTDSAAWLIYEQLPAAEQQTLLQALFGPSGSTNAFGIPSIHLNFLRIGIGASGAMTTGAPYSYDDVLPGESDPSLTDFSIAHDLQYTIPTLRAALAINPALEILATPWSPPAWMKSNASLDNVGASGTLLPSDYSVYASYLVKAIQAYAQEGVPIDALTPQNEPSSGQTATAYPGLTLPETQEAQFIAADLAPALQAAGLSTKIYGNDLSWDSLAYADGLMSGPASGDFAGIAWHCYFGSPQTMSALAQTAPGLDQIVDECSPEIRPVGTPEFLISSLRNDASVASVWSLALDPNGGPIQPGNDCTGCTGPVTINEQTQTVTFRPEYYQLGQVSAFVMPGAWRIDSPSFVTYGANSSNFETATPGLDDVAFLNPNGSKVLVAYNNSGAPITFGVQEDGNYFTYTIPARAMTTFEWQ